MQDTIERAVFDCHVNIFEIWIIALRIVKVRNKYENQSLNSRDAAIVIRNCGIKEIESF